MYYKAIVFDLDGTLLDTLDDLADSTNAVLQSYGFPVHGREAYKYFVGAGVENLLKSALPPGAAVSLDRKKLVDQFNTEYGQRWNRNTKPYNSISSLLDWLRMQHIPVSVLSNKPDYFTRLFVSTLFPGRDFTCVYGAREGVARKPDPAGCLAIAAKTGIEPGAFLYAGDSGIDMRTALAAGMNPVGVLWGFRGADELKDNGAVFLVEEPRQIGGIFLHNRIAS